jgi:hypothetical protein
MLPRGGTRCYAAFLLFEETRIADGDLPVDPRTFAQRLARAAGQGASAAPQRPQALGSAVARIGPSGYRMSYLFYE